eukprot:1869098-Prymnesium_polylepis.1
MVPAGGRENNEYPGKTNGMSNIYQLETVFTSSSGRGSAVSASAKSWSPDLGRQLCKASAAPAA